MVVNILKDTDDMDFQTLLDYIANITEKLKISAANVQLGLSFYSYFRPARHHNYSDCSDRQSFMDVLSDSPHPLGKAIFYIASTNVLDESGQ